MQEEEKTAVTSAESSETPAPPEAGEAERSQTVLPEEPETGSSEKGEAKSKTPSEPKDKIKAIRTTLFHIAQEEEEEAVSLRVAYQIRQVKDQKEHPEKYPPPPPRVPPKPKKKTFGQKMLDLFPQRGDSGGEVVRKSIFLFSAAVFLVCVVLIVLYFVDIFRADKMYDDIGSAYHANFATQTTELTQPQPESEEPTEKIYTLLPGAADLLAMNSEINGWISIPNTKVDYPVLHHLDDEPGNEYYLYRNMQKEDSKPGSIFLDYRCSFDDVGEDGTLQTPNSDNLIIYGHNMRDLSMFGTLKYYRTDENYYDEHPLISLNSNYETYQYKIFGYFIADAGVANAHMPKRSALTLHFFLQIFQSALGLRHSDFPVLKDGNAGGVIAAVFQFSQTVQQNLRTVPFAHISNNSTHLLCLTFVFMAAPHQTGAGSLHMHRVPNDRTLHIMATPHQVCLRNFYAICQKI